MKSEKIMSLTNSSHWHAFWEQRQNKSSGFIYFEDLRKYLNYDESLSFFEIGCAPGGILADFCIRCGYTANGIDFSTDPTIIKDYLRRERVRIGEIYHDDFLKWRTANKYDIVSSFGFIEHFENPGVVADKHFDIARAGGKVIIGIPNYARGQMLLHWLFDREVLRTHNLRCMNLPFLRSVAKRNNAHLIQVGYVGGHFEYWGSASQKPEPLGTLRNYTIELMRRLVNVLPGQTNSIFSPYMIAVYEKKT